MRQAANGGTAEWIAKTRFDFDRRRCGRRRTRPTTVPTSRDSDVPRERAHARAGGIAGSLAELGVYKGTTAKPLHELMPRAWLFDTFD
jgi:hypothetical protein